MTTVYDGERTFYLDDKTGRLWDSENKATEYDPNTHDELTKKPEAKKEEPKEVALQVHKFKKHKEG